uniref:FTH domain-containing protein n=1 Tax=Panagrellus redivivus TaxID=6233 RepID=A0A7E4WBG9_PANRE
MTIIPQLAANTIDDFDGLIKIIESIKCEKHLQKFASDFPSLGDLIYEHGHIFTNVFKIVKNDCYALRKKPSESQASLKKLDNLDEIRTTVKKTLIMENCNIFTVESLINVGFEFENATRLIVSNCIFTPEDLHFLLNGGKFKSIYFENCFVNEEVHIFKYWQYFYNATDLILDIKNLIYGSQVDMIFGLYRRTNPCATIALHNLPKDAHLDTIFKYISTSPTCPRLVLLNFAEKKENIVLQNCAPLIELFKTNFHTPVDVKMTSKYISIRACNHGFDFVN